MKKYIAYVFILLTSNLLLISITQAAPAKEFTYYLYRDLPPGSKDNGRCIDIKGGKGKQGAKLHLYKCHLKLNQRWRFTNKGEIIGDNGLCLDAPGGKGQIGDRLQVWPCNGSYPQKWKFKRYSGDVTKNKGHIGGINGLCIGAKSGGNKNKDPIVLVNCRDKDKVVFNRRVVKSHATVLCAKQAKSWIDKELKMFQGRDIQHLNHDTALQNMCERNNDDAKHVFNFVLKDGLRMMQIRLHKK